MLLIDVPGVVWESQVLYQSLITLIVESAHLASFGVALSNIHQHSGVETKENDPSYTMNMATHQTAKKNVRLSDMFQVVIFSRLFYPRRFVSAR